MKQSIDKHTQKDKINEICTECQYIKKTHGVRCLVSIILVRPSIDQFKQTYFNLSNHIVTCTIHQSTATKEVCKFVKINANSNSCIQTNILG